MQSSLVRQTKEFEAQVCSYADKKLSEIPNSSLWHRTCFRFRHQPGALVKSIRKRALTQADSALYPGL